MRSDTSGTGVTPPLAPSVPDRLSAPTLAALTALAAAAFITLLTEALPAGVLPALSTDLGVGESAAGQTVTVYAIGSAAAAIPLSAATSTWRRRRLLLITMAGFAVANAVTAVSAHYPLTLAARFVAGVAAGLVWAMLAGYARRLVPGPLQGRALTIAMAGAPLALSLGVPAGTLLGQSLGWRVAFWTMTALAAALALWIAVAVPDFPGQPRGHRAGVARTLRVPGVLPVLCVTLAFVLAHNILYTYIATFLDRLGLGGSVDTVLFAFGVASVAGIVVVGARIDRRLRLLTLAGTVLFAVSATVLALPSGNALTVHAAAALWGLGFGGAASLFQTAVADAAGDAADTAQSLLVTLWNAAIAGGGIVGGVLLDALGPGAFPWSVLALLAPVLAIVTAARRHGFPPSRPGATEPSSPSAR
ncbi:MFS transporter [Streptomyces sp. NPDC048290]|uniref:MFS transporter n=1 Tax=Streptomyces sp. NPDC048290 TaxID=3155811 RepID=UPI0034186CE0